MSTTKVHPKVRSGNDTGRTPIESGLSRAILSNSHFLAKAELYFTAFLSMSNMADMASDIVMVVSLSSGAWGDGLLGEPLCGGCCVCVGMLPEC